MTPWASAPADCAQSTCFTPGRRRGNCPLRGIAAKEPPVPLRTLRPDVVVSRWASSRSWLKWSTSPPRTRTKVCSRSRCGRIVASRMEATALALSSQQPAAGDRDVVWCGASCAQAQCGHGGTELFGGGRGSGVEGLGRPVRGFSPSERPLAGQPPRAPPPRAVRRRTQPPLEERRPGSDACGDTLEERRPRSE